jgi:hypothetical protein
MARAETVPGPPGWAASAADQLDANAADLEARAEQLLEGQPVPTDVLRLFAAGQLERHAEETRAVAARIRAVHVDRIAWPSGHTGAGTPSP